MIGRRRAIHLALAAALSAAGLLPSSAARAQQSFQRFFPLLVDLQGWKGNKPDGISMEMPDNNKVVTTTREYERGEARLNAQIIIGAAAQGALEATNPGMKIETSDARMSTSTIDGFQATRTFTISDKSGSIIVALGTSARPCRWPP